MWNTDELDGIGVRGENIRSIMRGFGSFSLLASRILLDEGLGMDDGSGMIAFEPQQWYPLRRFLRAFERVGAEFGDYTLRQVGLSVPRGAPAAPGVNDIESRFRLIDVIYHLNHAHRGEPLYSPASGQMREGIGHYRVEREGDTCHLVCEVDGVYPCAFDQGVLQAVAQQFEPRAMVTHRPGSCRKRGGARCVYDVIWK